MTGAAGDIWITMTDLRRHFHRVLREVEQGVTFTITRRGRPVARLVPAGAAEGDR
jgi:prevent-host-death family protein